MGREPNESLLCWVCDKDITDGLEPREKRLWIGVWIILKRMNGLGSSKQSGNVVEEEKNKLRQAGRTMYV